MFPPIGTLLISLSCRIEQSAPGILLFCDHFMVIMEIELWLFSELWLFDDVVDNVVGCWFTQCVCLNSLLLGHFAFWEWMTWGHQRCRPILTMTPILCRVLFFFSLSSVVIDDERCSGIVNLCFWSLLNCQCCSWLIVGGNPSLLPCLELVVDFFLIVLSEF